MQDVIKIFKSIQATNSLNDKKDIIIKNKDNELFKKCLVFLCDDNITTGLSAKKLHKKVEPSTELDPLYLSMHSEFNEVIDYLARNNTGRDCDIYEIQCFLSKYNGKELEFYEQMIAKTLRLGIDAKTINKCIPNLIHVFNVQLGVSIEKIKLKGDEWISISQKLNGTRCCFVGDKFLTRQGKEYIGLDHIKEDLLAMGYDNMFIDGELVYKNEEGLSDSEAFQIGCGIANSKATNKPELKMVVFDMFPIEEFWSGKSNMKYSDRLNNYLYPFQKKLLQKPTDNLRFVDIFYQGTDHSEIDKWLEYAENNDLEGVMLNLDTTYETKRTKNLIKVKRFYEIDLRCTSVNIADTGKYKDKLGSITCKFGDSTVDVGSGFSDEQRDYYTKHPEEIIGKIIAIRYKEMTTSKTGNKSLQFPTLLAIREGSDKNVADDENIDDEFYVE